MMLRVRTSYLLCATAGSLALILTSGANAGPTVTPARNVVRITVRGRKPPVRPDLPVVIGAYEPKGHETLEQLEAAYTASREWRKRLDVLLKLIDHHPDDPDWVYKLAANYSAMSWYDDSIDTYVRFATKWPAEPRFKDACIAISDDLQRSGRAEEDYKYLSTLPRDTPEWDIWVSVKMSERQNYNLRRDFDLSDRLCEDLIGKYPGHPLVYMAYERLADNYLNACKPERRDYGKAQAEYEHLLADFPDKPGAFFWHIRIADAAGFQKDYKTAILHTKAAIEKFPEDYPRDNWQSFNRYNLGSLYRTIGDNAAAEATWLEVVDRYPKDCWADMARKKLGIPSVPEDASYTLRTASFRLDAASGLRVLVSAPEIAPLPEEDPSAVFQVWDSRGPVDDSNMVITVLDPDGRDCRMTVTHASGGHYEVSWVFETPGTYRIGFRMTANGKTYGEGDLTRCVWKVGPPLLPVFTPAELKTKAGVLLLDVTMHPSEWVQGAKLIAWSKIEEAAPSLPKDRLIAVYTSAFGYPHETAVQLKKLGFNVAAVHGGIQAFKDAGWPTEKEEP